MKITETYFTEVSGSAYIFILISFGEGKKLILSSYEIRFDRTAL